MSAGGLGVLDTLPPAVVCRVRVWRLNVAHTGRGRSHPTCPPTVIGGDIRRALSIEGVLGRWSSLAYTTRPRYGGVRYLDVTRGNEHR